MLDVTGGGYCRTACVSQVENSALNKISHYCFYVVVFGNRGSKRELISHCFVTADWPLVDTAGVGCQDLSTHMPMNASFTLIGRLDRLSQSWERFKTFQLPIPALTAPIISSLISGHHITANVFLKALETSGWCQSVLTAQLHIFYIIFCQWKLSLPLVVASAHSESHLFYLCSLRVFGPNWYFLTNHWAHSYTKASMQYLLWSSGTQGFVITEATPAHRSLHTQKVIRNLGCRMRSSAAESSSSNSWKIYIFLRVHC